MSGGIPGLGPMGAVLLYVDDFEGMSAFYRDTLGLEVSHTGPGAIAFRVGGCILELMARSNDPNPRETGPSSHVLSFSVADLDAARRALSDAGVEQIGDVRPTIGLEPPFHIARFADPEGNLFELIDMPPGFSPEQS